MRGKVGLFVVLVLVVLAAAGGGYWFLVKRNLADLINGSTTATTADRAAQAVAMASLQLDALQRADVAVRVSEDSLRQLLAAYKKPLQDQGVDDVTLTLAPQRLQLAGKVKLTLSNILSVGDLLVEGHVEGAAAAALADRGLVLAPAFDRVIVDKAAVSHSIDLARVLPAINAGLDLFLSRLNGSLTALGPRRIDFGAGPIWDPSTVAQSGPGGGPAAPKFWLDRSALLIEPSGLRAMAALAYQAVPPPPASVAAPAAVRGSDLDRLFGGYRQAFDGKWTATFPAPPLDRPDAVAFRPGFLAETLGRKWPALDPDAGRWRAIAAASVQLGSLDRTAVAIRIQAAPLIAIAKERLLAKLNIALAHGSADRQISIETPEITTGPQRIETNFTLHYADPNLSIVADVAGHIVPLVYGNQLRFLPAFDTLRVREAAQRRDGIDLAAGVPLANEAITELLATINGALTAEEVIKPLDIGIKPIAPVDIRRELRKIQGVVDSSGPVIDPSVHYENPVLLIDASTIQVIARLALGPAPASAAQASALVATTPPPADLDARFADLEARFTAARDRVDAPPSDAPIWLAVRRDALGGLLDTLLGHFDQPACATYGIAFSAPYDLDLKSFSGSLPDCTPQMACDLAQDTRDCRRPPQCDHPHDTRSCSACLANNPFGGCILRGNDPFCEAQKAAQNSAYDAGFAACQAGAWIDDQGCEAEKGVQNGLYAGQKASCEINKTALKGKCETLKALQQQLQVLARVKGEIHASGSAKLCVPGIAVDQNLGGIALDVALSGHGIGLDGYMDFKPESVLGDLVGCVIPWHKSIFASVDIRDQRVRLAASIAGEAADRGLTLKFTTADTSVGAQMSPPPFEAIFAEHPDLAVICPILFMAGGTATLLNAGTFAASGNDLVPELRGQLKIPVNATTFSFTVPPQVIPLDEKTSLVAAPHLSAAAIWFSGNVESR